MTEKRRQWIKSFLFCFICNGALIAFCLAGGTRPVILGAGVLITFILWFLIVSTIRTPEGHLSGEATTHPVPESRQSSDAAVQLLAALQREGRLIDFLQEDLGDYGDDQIGAAVRSIHRGCRETLKEHMDDRTGTGGEGRGYGHDTHRIRHHGHSFDRKCDRESPF
jgi:hypothetical protein